MKLSEAKERFICEWGKLCHNWGVNKTMGQIHALLLVSDRDLCADEIMEELKFSRGNVNMNLRALIDWQLVDKVNVTGERKDFFKAEKDLTKVFKLIVEHRKKKELDPLVNLLDEISAVQPQCQKSNEFCRMVKKLTAFSHRVDHALAAITSSKSDWLSKILLR